MLSGKKTYIVVGFSLLALILTNLCGIPVAGMVPSPDWVNEAVTLVMGATIRSGIAKS